jgi:SdrD B-like protein
MRIHPCSSRGHTFWAALQALEPRTLLSTVISVTNTNDHGAGSLRAAINQADTYSADTEVQIKFKIPGSDVQTIEPLSALPIITAQVDIQGPVDSNGNPLIEIDGADAGANADGLTVGRDTPGNTNPSIIANLAVNRFGDTGIDVYGDAPTDVYGCRIGTDPTGKKSRPNDIGMVIGSADDQIGLAKEGTRYQNVISANDLSGITVGVEATDATIQNCMIGTDITGEKALPNIYGIVVSATDLTIGGDGKLESNLISGNSKFGIYVLAVPNSDLKILANRIGTNVAGTAAIPNGTGIEAFKSSSIDIGDGTGAGSNLISGNSAQGVNLAASNSNQITKNLIGTDAAGTAALPNQGGGVTIGDAIANDLYQDVIAGNADNGVLINSDGSLTQADNVSQCDIGTDATGKLSIPNTGDGILINSASDTQITSDVIDNNEQAGVQITGANASGNQLNQGSIYGNKDLGFVLGTNLTTPLPNVTPGSVAANTEPDDELGYPVLTSAQDIGVKLYPEGTYQGTPNTEYTILFYADSAAASSGYGQGQTFVASEQVTTDGSGSADIGEAIYEPPYIAPGSVLTAVAEQEVVGGDDTSEFAQDVPVTGAYVTGSVFDDVNGNGKQDSGEKGLANETVFYDDYGTGVYQVGDPSATTNSKGNYSFFVPPGTDHIRIVVPSGYEETDPSAKKPYYKITVASNSTTPFTGLNFGLMPIPAKSSAIAPAAATNPSTNSPAAIVITGPISLGIFFSERALLTT